MFNKKTMEIILKEGLGKEKLAKWIREMQSKLRKSVNFKNFEIVFVKCLQVECEKSCKERITIAPIDTSNIVQLPCSKHPATYSEIIERFGRGEKNENN